MTASGLLVAALLLNVGCYSLALEQSCDDFGFATFYASHMVLQRAPERAVVWGYALAEGDSVTATLDDQTVITNAIMGPMGRPIWKVTFDPMEAGGPYTLLVTSGECDVQLSDVLFGDVWLCSGQSNMQHSLRNIDDSAETVEDVSNYPNVRTFVTRRTFSQTPYYDLDGVQQNWMVPVPGTTQYFSAVCWLFGRNLQRELQIPIGLVQSAWGGTRIEAWSSPEALETCWPGGVGLNPGSNQNRISALYNAMIHPLHTMSMKGAIWYQGESNQNNADKYGCALGAMVKSWRDTWYESTAGETDPMFPFGQVQLAPWRDQYRDEGFPDVRWYQTAEYGFTPNAALENIFTAVAMDLPDYNSPFGNIHPRYKRQIADRLSLGAFALAYGLENTGRYQGPYPAEHHLYHRSLEITFDDGNTLLEYRSEDGFEICCAQTPENFCTSVNDGGPAQWKQAPIVDADPDSLILYNLCTTDEFVTGVRYAWQESPCPLEACAVYSQENDLPLAPYRVNQYLPDEGVRA